PQAGLAAAAADTRLQHHAAPDRHVRRRRRDHLAGDVAAGDVRHRDADAGQAAPRPQIEVIERTGTDAHQDLAWHEVRIRRLLVAKDVRASMLMKTNGPHDSPTCSATLSGSRRTRA